MTALHRVLGVTARDETRSVSFTDLWGKGLDVLGAKSASGIAVTPKNSMQLSAVFGSVRILTDGVSTLPVESDQVAKLSWLTQPSMSDPFLDMSDVLGQIMVSLLHAGNAFVATPRNPAGKIIELTVLDPTQVKKIAPERGMVAFEVQGVGRRFTPFEIAHVPGMMLPGALIGIAPLDYARETVGLGLAAQKFGAGFFGNGANPSGLIEVDGPLSDEDAVRLRRRWKQLHSGSESQGVAVLTKGATFKQLTVSPEQAQFLATRQFQVPDIARFFGVPPHLLQDASGSTSWGSGLAEQTQNYVTHSLRPWVERVESFLTRLVRSDVPAAGRVSLSLDHLLRGDFNSRVANAVSAVGAGILTVDEGRQIVDPRLAPFGPGFGGTEQ